MSGSRAAIRYAKAILSLANSNSKSEAVYSDMQVVAKTISENQELQDFLRSEIMKSEAKKDVLHKVFSNTDPLTKELFNLLVENKRVDIMDIVAAKYIKLYDEQMGKEVATVTTAVPMTSDMELKVLAKVKELTSKSVELQNVIDESILGGFILRIGDLQYDASIINKLNNLKREFTLN